MRRLLPLLVIVLAGCAGRPRREAPPAPAAPPPTAAVTEAVPQPEARSAHGNPPFYDVNGQRYVVLANADGFVERGVASWYGPDFHGKNTASGERYDMYAMTAAHRTLPIPCYARITNLSNGRSVIVRINDRGPFASNRIVDLSYSAATKLDIVRHGTAFVELRTVDTLTDAAAAATEAPPPPAPQPPAVSAPGPLEPTAPLALYVQVGAFADPANAQRVLARLQSAQITNAFVVTTGNAAHPLQRVRVGPVATVDQFDQLVAQLGTLGYSEARLATD
ncbi:MAG TPA: septal ring lytic transglycosylase RlpA family protein [Steroidobacteraceae bacterium]